MPEFKLTDTIEVNRTVTIHVPYDGTGYRKDTLDVRFKMLDSDEAQALHERAKSGRDDIELLREVFIGLPKGVLDESGQRLDDSPEIRERLIKIPFVRIALVKAYNEAQMGALSKN